MEYNTIFENINVNVKVGEDSDEDEYTCEYCTTTQDHNWCFRCNTENICESCNGHGGDYGENEEWVCDNCLPTCLECGKQLFVRGDECCENGRSDITEEEEDVMSKPILSRTYTLGMGACDTPENGGISEIQKIMVMNNQKEEDVDCFMSKPILSRAYTLGMGACDAPENGGISEIQKILVMNDQKEEKEKEDDDRFVICEECNIYIDCNKDNIHIVYKDADDEKPLEELVLCTMCFQDMEDELIQQNYKCDEWEEEEEGIGCNECYACVTGGAGPCVKDKE